MIADELRRQVDVFTTWSNCNPSSAAIVLSVRRRESQRH
jgi:hypothetical protein